MVSRFAHSDVAVRTFARSSFVATLLLAACHGGDEATPVFPLIEGKQDVPPRAVPFSEERVYATSAIVEPREATVVTLRQPNRPVDAFSIGEILARKLGSGSLESVMSAFTDEVILHGAQPFPGPFQRRALDSIVKNTNEVKALTGVGFRDIRRTTRTLLTDSANPRLGLAVRYLPPSVPGEMIFLAAPDRASHLLFTSGEQVVLVLRDDGEGPRIRAIIDEPSSKP